MFQEIATYEEYDDSRQNTSNELIKIINKDECIEMIIYLMYSLKNTSGEDKQDKSICILHYKDKNYADPLVDLEIEGYHVRQVVLDFRSQVNIMNRLQTWMTTSTYFIARFGGKKILTRANIPLFTQ